MILRSLALSLLGTLIATGCVLKDFEKGPALNSASGATGGSSSHAGSGASDAGAKSSGGTESIAADACVGTACNTPPANLCADAGHLTAYDKVGGCVDGKCSYTSRSIECACQGDACTSDPCGGIVCNEPPKPFCSASNMLSVFQSTGACDGGSCDYPLASDRACSAATPFCAVFNGEPACGECVDDTLCGAWHCSGGKCVGERHCGPLAPTVVRTGCGDKDHDKSCCASDSLAGGSFNLHGDPVAGPAYLSPFSLDNYEVTVGRFRQFVGSYHPQITQSGDGANPNHRDDPGWIASWNAYMPVSREHLGKELKCEAPNHTWTDEPGANEALPINCVAWHEAFAFCIWENEGSGRLPTEAEWVYAAQQGNLQTTYPWGNTPAPGRAQAAFGGLYFGTSQLDGFKDIARVGSISGGYNRFNQADLAGNVAEYVMDYFENGAFPLPCDDCAQLFVGNSFNGTYVVRGGAWSSAAAGLASTARDGGGLRSSTVGFRCASPP